MNHAERLAVAERDLRHHAKQLEEHDGDINSLKEFRARLYGGIIVASACGGGIVMILEIAIRHFLNS